MTIQYHGVVTLGVELESLLLTEQASFFIEEKLYIDTS